MFGKSDYFVDTSVLMDIAYRKNKKIMDKFFSIFHHKGRFVTFHIPEKVDKEFRSSLRYEIDSSQEYETIVDGPHSSIKSAVRTYLRTHGRVKLLNDVKIKKIAERESYRINYPGRSAVDDILRFLIEHNPKSRLITADENLRRVINQRCYNRITLNPRLELPGKLMGCSNQLWYA